ncbi:ERBB-3 BINDING PROTEIN 1-like [Cucurbita moschata]|uniref:ERBB-3 BINDING PROTEIN 1-like n=1 Tax=Cucurbita moschata TaxID=3662 RepID=A0A6J1GEJ4_CUCMO|nr:ERBB-3 BINDING PROTEIN 1-like [Cucurbita moschata]
MSSDDEREEVELDLSSPDVVTNYKNVAEIVNEAMQLAISECNLMLKSLTFAKKAISFLREKTSNMYKNVQMKIERALPFQLAMKQ